MMIGSSFGLGGVSSAQVGVPSGLFGSMSLGSGLRAGVDLVGGAIKTAAELAEAREQAREALEEQALAEARDAALRDQLIGRDDDAADGSPKGSLFPGDDQATQTAIGLAVVAGQSGSQTGRGAFLDLSI
jgi:hypothetical protein